MQFYLIYSALYLVGLLAVPDSPLMFYAKWALLPILLLTVWQKSDFALKNLLLAALFFSWIGDVVIAYAPKGEMYFILGLLSFLVAHVMYIVLFWKSLKNRSPKKGHQWWLFALLLVYICAFLALLFPSLGGLKIPVVVYALIIGTMLASALYGKSFWNATAAGWIVLGAASFVVSDSTLAVNKFYHALPLASIWVMSTYLFAQYALVKGILLLDKK